MFPIRILPSHTSFNFLGKKWGAFIISIVLVFLTFALLFTKGLNLGIDFTGGVLVETGFEEAPDLAVMRRALAKENLGDISLQHFGNDKTIMIRVGQQEGTEKDRLLAVDAIKEALAEEYGNGIDYRKVDYVGPKVGSELIRGGLFSLFLAFVAIMIYIWLRFEWHYGVGAIVALIHDVFLTIGFYSITQLEFNLSSIAALLTIIGYSINDSVVIFDRSRENIRKYKKMPYQQQSKQQ